jgi:hypothetical protein
VVSSHGEPGAPNAYFDERPHLGLCENGTLIECPFRGKSAALDVDDALPVYPDMRTILQFALA